LATLILAFIGVFGYKRGLRGLERLEEYSVTVKLAIIVSLLFGLGYHGLEHGYRLDEIPAGIGDPWEQLRLLGGMLLIVQGFETSKYLDSAYSREVRVRSMLSAQLLAGAIYMLFIVLAMPLMTSLTKVAPSETGIIELAVAITPVLPFMLVVAAVMSQFSAAIADTLGAGGVVEAESKRRVSSRSSYPFIALCAAVLIWTTDIFQIVALASRAFALYYLLQTVLAIRMSADFATGIRRLLLVLSFVSLAVLLGAIMIFAKPVEG
jgi:hypothetical protein